MKFYLVNQTQTVGSALRTALEHRSDGLEFVSCTHLHPLDTHLEVETPSARLLRHALLDLQAALAQVRVEVATHQRPS